MADLFTQAVTAYQAQDWIEAERLCREVSAADATHAASLHMLGSLAARRQDYAEAEDFMRRSLSLTAGTVGLRLPFAHILLMRGKTEEAVGILQGILAEKPDHAEAMLALGKAFKAQGDVTEAGRRMAQALILRPDYIDALNALGVLFCEQKMFQESEDCLKRLVELKPDLPEAHNNLAVVCFESGRYLEAERYCEKALELNPTYAAAWTNRGNALKAQEKWSQAIESYEQALKLNPNLAETINNLGLATLHGLGDVEAARAHLLKALALRPDYVPALTHLGIVYAYTGDFASAMTYYDQALALQPAYVDAQNNLGNALRAAGRGQEAIANYRAVTAAKPDDAEALHNLALALLAEGDYEEGWRLYEDRWRTKYLRNAVRPFSQPQWQGEEAEGKTLLIHAEQGFGDSLQFCRYAPLAAQQRGMRVILEVPPELVRLLQSLPAIDQVIARGEALPDFDLHCPMMSLPFAFGTRVDSIPASTAYLFPVEREVALWQERLPSGPKVGLVWAGSPRRFSSELSFADRRRSIAPDLFAALAKVKGVSFISLQKDGESLPAELKAFDFMEECRDFADTAALIANLDLVITVDTAVAHLAAALGRPTWILSRADGCWRWLTEREDSPWYPSVRLFRQKMNEGWPAVIERVVAAFPSEFRV